VQPADDADDAASTIERMLAIKAMPLLGDVHPDELAVIAEHARFRTFRRGETLYSGAQAPVSAIHLVVDGRVTEHRGGRPFVTHGPHRVLGGEDALALAASDVVAVADEDTRTLAIDRDRLRDVLEDNFGVLSAALQGVAAATLRLRRRIVPSAGWSAPPPLARARAPMTDDLGARVAFLWRETWLGSSRIRTLGQLATEAAPVGLREGETLWATGDDAEDMLVVIDGRVRCATDDGRQRFDAGRGAVLGLEEALAMEARWYGAVVQAPGSGLRITRAALIDVLEDDPDSALELLAACATLASGLRDLLAHAGGGRT
jgi:CRP-like cAMP-binding protein